MPKTPKSALRGATRYVRIAYFLFLNIFNDQMRRERKEEAEALIRQGGGQAKMVFQRNSSQVGNNQHLTGYNQ